MKATKAIEMSINSAQAEIEGIIESIKIACSKSENVIVFEEHRNRESLSAGARMYFEYYGFEIKHHTNFEYDWSIKWDLDFLLSLNRKNISIKPEDSTSSLNLGNYAGVNSGSDGPGFFTGVVLGGLLF